MISEDLTLARTVESPFFTGLVFVAFALLLSVSGGVGYLTIVEWRDRRRRERESREDKQSTRSKKGKSK